MLEKKFKNVDLGIEITSYIDKQQNIWFCGKDVAKILGYSKTRDALSRHVDNEDKKQIVNCNCKYLIIHSPQGFSGIIYNTGWGTLPDCLRCSLQVMKE